MKLKSDLFSLIAVLFFFASISGVAHLVLRSMLVNAKAQAPKIVHEQMTPGSIMKVDPVTGKAEFTSDDALIQTYATNGAICKVLGHHWDLYKGFQVVRGYETPPTYRQCTTCKRIERQNVSWTEVRLGQLGEELPLPEPPK